jgi:hypothetical protein
MPLWGEIGGQEPRSDRPRSEPRDPQVATPADEQQREAERPDRARDLSGPGGHATTTVDTAACLPTVT